MPHLLSRSWRRSWRSGVSREDRCGLHCRSTPRQAPQPLQYDVPHPIGARTPPGFPNFSLRVGRRKNLSIERTDPLAGPVSRALTAPGRRQGGYPDGRASALPARCRDRTPATPAGRPAGKPTASRGVKTTVARRDARFLGDSKRDDVRLSTSTRARQETRITCLSTLVPARRLPHRERHTCGINLVSNANRSAHCPAILSKPRVKAVGFRSNQSREPVMSRKKISILSIVMAGGLVFAGVTAAGVTTGYAPPRPALAANAAASPPVNLDNCPVLAEGYHGGCVNQLQAELNAHNGADMPVDGIFGAATKEAVMTFQQDHHIVPADGIVRPQTKAVLDNPESSAASAPTAGSSTASPSPGTSDGSGAAATAPVGTAPSASGPSTPNFYAGMAPTAMAPSLPGAKSCVNPHCYDRAVDYHGDIIAGSTRIQSTWFSMLDQTKVPYRTPVIENSEYCGGTCPWFITREMWIGDQQHWIEVGLRNGYEYPQWRMPDGTPGCGCQAYFQFWEDGAGSADTHTHVIANVAPDNAWHTYGISRVSGGTFDITVDGRVVGVSTVSGVTSFGQSAIGSETSGLTTVQPLSYMNTACQSWSVEDTSDRWFGVGSPNAGLRGYNDPYHGSPLAQPFHGSAGGPDQTYFGGWNSATHQLCIGKGSL